MTNGPRIAPELAKRVREAQAEIQADLAYLDELDQTFEEIDEGRYRMAVAAVGVTLEVDYLRRERHQLVGELTVRCDLPGASTFGGVLSAGDFNFSSTRVRSTQAKYLAERAKTKDFDWVGLLEEYCQRVLAAERKGKPAVILGELSRPPISKNIDVAGLSLLIRHPSILFGDGSTAKSLLLLYILGLLARQGMQVILLDSELCEEEHRERLERLFGSEMPVVHYVRCERPFVHEVDRIRRIVRDLSIDYAGFDSIAFACDGPPEAAETASKYFQALRRLGTIGSLHVAHVTKAFEGADQKPFGSTFWHNGARATWNTKLADSSPDETLINVALHNRKANLGPKLASVGFEFRFGDDDIHVRNVDPAGVPDLAATLSVRQRMAIALARGAMSPHALAEEVNAPVETVKRTARRYRGKFTLIDGGRLGLLSGRQP